MSLPPILHEDEALLVFDKPSGLLVAPDRWDKSRQNLMAMVHARYGREVANVHRLDADTSGVFVCTKTKAGLDFLSGQFQSKTAKKVYHALVTGAPAEDEFIVDRDLVEDEGRPGLMRAVRKGGKPCLTEFKVLERFFGYSWIECRPQTGRTHQLRVHLAWSGTPIFCDRFYGKADEVLMLSTLKKRYKGRDEEKPLLARLGLHASELTLFHPLTKEPITLTAPVPKHLAVALKYLRKFVSATL